MEFNNFLKLYQEVGLVAIFVILLIYDIFASEKSKRRFRPVVCILLGLQTLAGFVLPVSLTGTAFGGIYISSETTVFIKNILNIATLFIFMQSGQWLRSASALIGRESEFYVVTLATLLGMYLMVSSANFMLLYISIELASLPVACLAAYDKYREQSAEAGAKYILFSAISSGIMMFGISYLYGAVGTMYFSDMSAVVSDSPMLVTGFVFFFAGLAFKISLVPFHLWTADVYQGAPTGITAYLSVVSKTTASFVLLCTLYHVFGNIEQVWRQILWAVTALSITVGNLFAIRQTDIKRFFAFSSISQAGYITLGIACASAAGTAASLYYILVYLFSNLAAFGVIAAVENKSGHTGISAYNGLIKSNPRLTLVMTLAVFSLAGVPPLSGFFSKYFIFAASFAAGDYVLLAIAVANTVVSLYYYLLIVKTMYINSPDENSPARFRTDNYNRITLTVCTAAIVLVGLFMSGIFDRISNLKL
jgi:NADH-quinone oxidoreductase subunit N